MRKIISISALVISLVGFYKTYKSNNSFGLTAKTAGQKDSIDFKLNTFSIVPKEIDGCGCYFYLSKQYEDNNKYIFVNDFASIGFVSINGKIEKFELKKHDENPSVYLYANSIYELKIEILKKSDKDHETSLMEGTISLSKKNKVVKKKFVGFCGC